MTSRSKTYSIGLVAAALAGALGFYLTSSSAPAAPRAQAPRASSSAAGERGPLAPATAPSSPTPVEEELEHEDSRTRPDPLAEPPRHFPRPAGEWQGMLVDLNAQAFCEKVDGCGLAMACKQGKCGPCVADGECASGEACVLDHCVKRALVECRQKSDCGGDAVCALSGYSSGLRGNDDLRAYCQARRGGERGSEEPRDPSLTIAAPPPPYRTADLLGDVQADAQK